MIDEAAARGTVSGTAGERRLGSRRERTFGSEGYRHFGNTDNALPSMKLAMVRRRVKGVEEERWRAARTKIRMSPPELELKRHPSVRCLGRWVQCLVAPRLTPRPPLSVLFKDISRHQILASDSVSTR